MNRGIIFSLFLFFLFSASPSHAQSDDVGRHFDRVLERVKILSSEAAAELERSRDEEISKKDEIEEVPILLTAVSTKRFANDRIKTALSRLAQYRSMMERAFREEGVPEWLIAVGFVESGYNASALSPKRALGIWQFIPETGSRYGLKRVMLTTDQGKVEFDERRDPEKSTRAAARYLRDLYALFGDWPLAIAAYNAGEKRVSDIMLKTGVRDFQTIADRRLLPAETIEYVPAVFAAARFINRPQINAETRESAIIRDNLRQKENGKTND